MTLQGHRETFGQKKTLCLVNPSPTTTTTIPPPRSDAPPQLRVNRSVSVLFPLREGRAAEGSFTFEYFGFSNCIFGALDPRPRRLQPPPPTPPPANHSPPAVAAVGFKKRAEPDHLIRTLLLSFFSSFFYQDHVVSGRVGLRRWNVKCKTNPVCEMRSFTCVFLVWFL